MTSIALRSVDAYVISDHVTLIQGAAAMRPSSGIRDSVIVEPIKTPIPTTVRTVATAALAVCRRKRLSSPKQALTP